MPGLDIEAEVSVLALIQDSQIHKEQMKSKKIKRRDTELDPLILAAAFASGPHVTRHHHSHDLFPAVGDPPAEGAWDWTKWTGQDAPAAKQDPKRRSYHSQQAPRRQRLKDLGLPVDSEPQVEIATSPTDLKPPSLQTQIRSPRTSISSETVLNERLGLPPLDDVQVKCMARTRIPTPHGPAFLHLYHNNKDNKEHLAIVIDPAQLEESSQTSKIPAIRSRSLDAEWSPNETTMERITRGAYVGKLSSNQHTPSVPPSVNTASSRTRQAVPPALVRIHSECFTGETIGSMRCDCGEQLDEAIRQISQPIVKPSSNSTTSRPIIVPGRGVVVYLRQEGRGIGLLSKIRAYNLQDLGHDTVTANILLGHGADERKYDIAGAILRDLGFGEGANGEAVRLLTNNPDKVEALEKEGLRVVERVPMVPKSWTAHQQQHDSVTIIQPGTEDGIVPGLFVAQESSRTVRGPDLDKYLRTKVLRMGHMLPLLGHGV